MITLTIDGREVRVEPSSTVIQAAEKLGIYVPRYCYHPGLSIAGSCRMCLVEIENMPKLQISCYTQAQDGMNVVTSSDQVKKARQSMLEFLLTDHPLDCPVCDQSGECDLQNFYMEHGRYRSKFVENKIKRRKAFPIGEHVMLDQERCILCTRCTRFTEEVTRTNELGCLNRGGQSVIDLFPGRTLDNDYSGNVIDICPVGALTERQFRFQCRVWYLSEARSICNGCSRGCNIHIHYNDRRDYKAGGRRVQRLKPRFNPHVNRWWMSDQGRFGFEFIDQNRIEAPHVRNGSGLEAGDWHSALDAAAKTLRDTLDEHGPSAIAVLASPQLSNEELWLLRQLFVEELRISEVAFANPWESAGPEDDFLLRSDRNPNSRGAREIGLGGDMKAILGRAASGEIRVLYVFSHDFEDDEPRGLLETPTVIFQGTNWGATAETADIVLAGATHAEKDGTFTNFEGRIQRFEQALLPIEDSRDDLEILADLGHRLGHQLTAVDPEQIFRAWRGLGYADMDEYGYLPERVQEVDA